MLYWLFPRLYNTKLWSIKLANYHFWIALLGMMFYVVPMYASGVTQGLMWKQFTQEGFLQYPNFLETVLQILPDVSAARHRRLALHRRRRADGCQPLAHGQERPVRAGDQEAQAAPLRGGAPTNRPGWDIAGWKPSRSPSPCWRSSPS